MLDNTDFLQGQTPTKSFKDVASRDMAKPPTVAADEFINIRMTLESFEILQGTANKGGDEKKYKYAVMKAMNNDLETIYIRCAGDSVVRQLEMINPDEDLPLFFTLKKDGKAWYLD